jgi:3-deoxy-D-manno-octulosonate 8-phosphate phosphatase (KDO 8-P phosphatase)
MSLLPEALRERLAAVRLLAMDVDGVLTDGTLYYGAEGEAEAFKAFHVRDGLGLRLLRSAGITLAVISARESAPLARRIRDLKIEHARFGTEHKGEALDHLAAGLSLTRAEVAFVGDDLLDLPAMQRAGVAITVQDGHPLVKQRADWVTAAGGGRGAVREVADALLAARGALEDTCARLLASLDPATSAQR